MARAAAPERVAEVSQDVFEKLGMDLTDDQKQRILEIAEAAFIVSGGRHGLAELLHVLGDNHEADALRRRAGKSDREVW